MIEVSVIVSAVARTVLVLATTDIAELVAAAACHMIAAFILLDPESAL